MVSGFGFSPPRFGGLQGAQPLRMQDLGPPDMAKLLMQGIGGLGESFQQGFQTSRRYANEDRMQAELEKAAGAQGSPAQQLMSLGAPGGPYGPQPQPGGYNQGGRLPTFAAISGTPGNNAVPGLQGELSRYGDAIASIESRGSGDYAAVGPQHPKYGRALGRYQVMESNIPEWSQAALGRNVSADEFLRNPQLQDAIFQHRFGGYVQKYGNPQDAASVWFTGRPVGVKGAGTARDSLGTSGNEYVAKFNRALGTQTPTQTAQAARPGLSTVQTQPQSPSVAPGAAELAAEQGGNAPWQQPAPQPQQRPWTNPPADLQQQPLPGQPTPQDREGAAAVVQNQTATQQAQQAQAGQARQRSFMGVPSLDGPQNVNPQGGPQEPLGFDPTVTGSLPAPPPPGVPQSAPPAPAALNGPAVQPPPVSPPVSSPVLPNSPPVSQPAGQGALPGLQPFAGIPQAAGAGANPHLLRALGYAARSGNPAAVSAVQSAIQMSGQNAADWTTADLGGQPALVNRRTAQVIPLGGGTPKAPETKEVNGRLLQWDGRQWVDATPAGAAGFRPMTDDERAAYNVRPGQPAFMGPDGKPSFGPAGSNVSITNQPENKADVKGAEAQAARLDKTIGGWAEQGQTAASNRVQLNVLGEIFARTGKEGYAAELKTQFGPLLEAAGFDIGNLSDTQTVQAIIERLAPAQRVVGSGSQSDAEYRGFLRSLPTLLQNPTSRNELLAMLQTQNEIDLRRAQIAEDYDMGEIDRPEAVRRNRELPKPEAIFREFRARNQEVWNQGQKDALARRDAGNPSKAKAPVVEMPSMAAAEKAVKAGRIKVGTRVRTPEGTFVVEPD